MAYLEKCKGCIHMNKCIINFPRWVLNDTGFINLQEPMAKFFYDNWTEKFIKAAFGAKGCDHGKETVDIAVPFFVNALK